MRTSRESVKRFWTSVNSEESKIFPNEAFGYWKVTVDRPLRIVGIDADRVYSAKDIRELKASGERSSDAPALIKKIHKRGVEPDPLRGLLPVQVDGKDVVVEYEPDTDMRDTEQVPLTYGGGIEGFLNREVLPYASDAWYNPKTVKIGYEISFTRHFYKLTPMRPLSEIITDIRALERESEGLLAEIIGLEN